MGSGRYPAHLLNPTIYSTTPAKQLNREKVTLKNRSSTLLTLTAVLLTRYLLPNLELEGMSFILNEFFQIYLLIKVAESSSSFDEIEKRLKKWVSV